MRSVSHKSNSAHYRADACVVWCFDNRFTSLLGAFMKKQKLRHVDLVKIAGGAKDIASPSRASDRAYLLKQIAASIRLHRTRKIILMAHKECGAYDGTRDKNFYVRELHKARGIVLRYFPDADVSVYFADFRELRKIEQKSPRRG